MKFETEVKRHYPLAKCWAGVISALGEPLRLGHSVGIGVNCATKLLGYSEVSGREAWRNALINIIKEVA